MDRITAPDSRRIYLRAIDRIEKAVKRSGKRDPVYIDNTNAGFSKFLPGTLFPGDVGYFVITYPDNTLHGKRVYFRSPDMKLPNRYRKWPNTRTSALLLGPGETDRPAPRGDGGA